MTKRFKSLIATAALAVAALASSMGAGNAADIALKLTTWTANSPGFQEWWPEVVEAFQAEHPGVTVELENVASADFPRYMTTRFIAGSPPDIVHVQLPTEYLAPWADAGFLEQLDTRLASTDIPGLWPDAQNAMKWKDATYGVLFADYGFVLFYNAALLEAAGVAVPTTPDELLAAAEKLTANGKFGFGITDDRSSAFVRGVLTFITGMGGQWTKDGAWNWTDPKVVEALDLWRKLAREFSPKGTDQNAKRQAFYNGDVAMMIENPSIWPNVKKAVDPALYPSIHLARFPLPVVPGDTSHGFALPTGIPEDRAALAWDFIQLVNSAKWQGEYVRLIKSPTSRPGASDILKDDPDTKVIVDAAEEAVLLISNDATSVRQHFSVISDALVDSFHALLETDAPTLQVMQEIDAALNAKGITP
jgi:multiple sugar transport system substrate-binding protein